MLEGPQVRYVRVDDVDDELARALRLAHEIEELLGRRSTVSDAQCAHSTRIARAMSASLIDELEALVRGARKSGVGAG
jgi:uncharacterized alpha-E superfamily protein